MRELKFLVQSFLLVFFISACDGGSAPSDEMTDSTAAADELGEAVFVSWKEVQSGKVADNSLFIVEGYIGDIGSYVQQYNNTINFPLYERRNQQVGDFLSISAPVGDTPNHIHEIPAQFLPEDFKLVCDDGTIVTRGDYVRATLKRGPSGSSYTSADLITLVKTESVFSDTVFKAAIPLTSEIIEDTTRSSTYCYFEGKLQMPEIVFSYTHSIDIDVLNSTVKELGTIAIPLGSGPSTMNDIPDNYTDNDLVVRDYTGKQIKSGAKVRFYGMWERYEFDSSFPGRFCLEEIVLQK